MLKNIDIQGPPYPYDSVCALIDESICITRQDVRLYSMNLEDKVISWFAKWNAVEGTRGKGRVDQHAPADILPVLCNVAHLTCHNVSAPSTLDLLPDCAIVDRILEEQRTCPIRQFTLFGKIPELPRTPATTKLDVRNVAVQSIDNAAFLEGRARRVSDMIGVMIEDFCRQWPSAKTELEARPAIQPDRCRRTIDAMVVALSYQASLQLNGIRTDTGVLQSVSRLIEMVVPFLKSAAYDIPALHLMWKGLEPLVHLTAAAPSLWPVLLRPNSHSGVRQDMLRYQGNREDEEQAEGGRDALLTALWNLPNVSIAPQLCEASLRRFPSRSRHCSSQHCRCSLVPRPHKCRTGRLTPLFRRRKMTISVKFGLPRPTQCLCRRKQWSVSVRPCLCFIFLRGSVSEATSCYHLPEFLRRTSS